MIVSQAIYAVTGFGPSKSICDPFAQQVIDEAAKIGVTLELDKN
jgi:hypothetical protein